MQHYRVDQTENSGVCANAQCQRKNGHRRKAWRFREHAKPVANVLPELLYPNEAPHFARLFLDSRHVAKLPHGRVARFLRGHAALNIVLRLLFNVVADILIEVFQHAFAVAHDLPPCLAGRRIRAIAPANLSHLPVSSVSCFLPLAVRR